MKSPLISHITDLISSVALIAEKGSAINPASIAGILAEIRDYAEEAEDHMDTLASRNHALCEEVMALAEERDALKSELFLANGTLARRSDRIDALVSMLDRCSTELDLAYEEIDRLSPEPVRP